MDKQKMKMESVNNKYDKYHSDKSRVSMIEKYFNIPDYHNGGLMELNLLPRQKDFLMAMGCNNKIIVPKVRQVGATTAILAKIACELALASKDSPETVLIVNPSLNLSRMGLELIKMFLMQIPRWFWGESFYGNYENNKRSIFVRDNRKELVLFNGSKVYVTSSGRDINHKISADSSNPTPITWLIFDEAAFIENGMTDYLQSLRITETDGHIIMISTQNRRDGFFYDFHQKSIKKENDFKIIEFNWFHDPRYNKNLKWEKNDSKTGEIDIIIMGTTEKDGSVEHNPEYWDSLIKKGYKPTSDWYLKTFDRFKGGFVREEEFNILGNLK